MAKKLYKGRYVRKQFNFNGKEHEVSAKTEAEACEKLVKKKKELEAGITKVNNPSLNEYYEHFTRIRRSEVKESTIRSQKPQFDLIAEVEIASGLKMGEMPVRDINRRIIEDARRILLEQGKSPQYLNNVFAHLNHILKQATIDEIITKNPCKALKQLKRDSTPLITEDRHRSLTTDETIAFFKAAKESNSHYYEFFMLMIKTGMRIGEVAALYPADIDRKNGFIHVRRTIRRNEDGSYIVGDDVKTTSGKRDIPLTEDILNIIRSQERKNRVLFGNETGGLIFRSQEGNIIRDYTVERELRRICNKAGIDYFSSHAFRNTYATRFMEQRPQDFKILSELLGHKDVSITLNLYTHVMTENKVKAMNDVVIDVG